MVNSEAIGKIFTSDQLTQVSAQAVADFARALSASDLESAPLTFAITITLAQAEGLLKESGLNWERVVHGEQGFQYFSPIFIGQELATSATIENVKVLAGNEIATVRIDLTDNQTKSVVVSTTSVLVVRA
jgi:N-terminal half of MaoC dehydratase